MKLIDFFFFYLTPYYQARLINKTKVSSAIDYAAFIVGIILTNWVLTILSILIYFMLHVVLIVYPTWVLVMLIIIFIFNYVLRRAYTNKGRYAAISTSEDPVFKLNQTAGVLICFATVMLSVFATLIISALMFKLIH
jgi:hypothetical protein